MRIIAFITDTAPVERILTQIGEPFPFRTRGGEDFASFNVRLPILLSPAWSGAGASSWRLRTQRLPQSTADLKASHPEFVAMEKFRRSGAGQSDRLR
jgi:hypothetical protein